MRAPPLAEAWVSAQDPDNESVFVLLGSVYGGQGPPIAVQVGTAGPRDATVGRHPALPTAGTHGLVAFPRGDYRNGVWICSISTQFADASAHAPGNGAADYAAHYGGGWSWRGQDGTVVEATPDGTVIQLGPVLPAPTRHTVDGQQQRQRTPYTPAQRVPQTPTPFPVSLTHPTGASAALNASGAWHLTAAPGQTLTLTANGANVVIDGSGNITLTSPGSITATATSAVNIRAPAISASNGGAALALKRADNSNTTVFSAE